MLLEYISSGLPLWLSESIKVLDDVIDVTGATKTETSEVTLWETTLHVT